MGEKQKKKSKQLEDRIDELERKLGEHVQNIEPRLQALESDLNQRRKPGQSKESER